MDISFIEEMPLGVISDHDRAEAYYSSDEIRADLEQRYTLLPTTETTGGPSRYYKIIETNTKVGFISPHSHNFCDNCNRVRLTCEGRLLLCLGQEHSVDLRQVIRTHPGDTDRLKQALRASMDIKPKGHEFDLSIKPVIFRHMNMTGRVSRKQKKTLNVSFFRRTTQQGCCGWGLTKLLKSHQGWLLNTL